jgi:2-phosphosulfolactate phosphatase
LKTFSTCFSPALYPLFKEQDSIVVVVDILRATSAICTAIHHGVGRLIPVAGVDEALDYKKQGFLVAAERNAIKLDGFDFGNSPYHFMDEALKGKSIVISTTNGTQAIAAASDAGEIVIGSFLHLSALADWLHLQQKNIIVLCAGWKNKFNMEDSLFAGALYLELEQKKGIVSHCDATIAMAHLYDKAKDNLYDFLEYSSHRHRLKNLNLEADIRYCLTANIFNTIPVYRNGAIVNQNAVIAEMG